MSESKKKFSLLTKRLLTNRFFLSKKSFSDFDWIPANRNRAFKRAYLKLRSARTWFFTLSEGFHTDFVTWMSSFTHPNMFFRFLYLTIMLQNLSSNFRQRVGLIGKFKQLKNSQIFLLKRNEARNKSWQVMVLQWTQNLFIDIDFWEKCQNFKLFFLTWNLSMLWCSECLKMLKACNLFVVRWCGNLKKKSVLSKC